MTCPPRSLKSQRHGRHTRWVTTILGPESVFSKRCFLCRSSAPATRSPLNGSGRSGLESGPSSRRAPQKRTAVVKQNRSPTRKMTALTPQAGLFAGLSTSCRATDSWARRLPSLGMRPTDHAADSAQHQYRESPVWMAPLMQELFDEMAVWSGTVLCPAC